jgi:hypothetical protein
MQLSRALGVGGLLSHVQSVGQALASVHSAASNLFAPRGPSVPAVPASPSVPAVSASPSVSIPAPTNNGAVSDELFALRPSSVRIPAPPRVPPVTAGPTTAIAARTASTAIPAAAGTAPAAGTAGAAGGAAGAAGSVAGLAAAAGPAALAIGGVAIAAVAAGAATKMMADAMHENAKRLEGYSAELSNVAARNELREELANIRRANAVGPQLANFENDRGRAMTAISDIGTQLLSWITRLYEDFRPAIDVGIKALEVTAAAAEVTAEASAGVRDLQRLRFDQAEKHFEKSVKATERIGKILEGDAEDDIMNDPFLDMFFGMAAPGVAPRLPRRPAAPLGV